MTAMLSPRQCSTRLGVSISLVLRLLNAKKIRASKIGGVWRVEPDALETYIASQQNTAEPSSDSEPVVSDLPPLERNRFL